MLKVYVEGKNLKGYTITANEVYGQHQGVGLASMGSPVQNALDFGCPVNLDVSVNTQGKVIQRGSTLGNFIAVDYGEFQICFVHVYLHDKWVKGSIIPAGTVFAAIAPTTLNGGYAPHLHIYATRNYKTYKVREIIFAAEPVTPPANPCQSYIDEMATYKSQIDIIRNENVTLKSQNETAVKQLRILESERDFLKVENSELSAKLSGAVESNKALEIQGVALQTKVEELTKSGYAQTLRIDELESEVARLKEFSLENLKLSDFVAWVGLKLGVKKSE